MTPRAVLSALFFGGLVTVAELWVVAHLSAPPDGPPPAPAAPTAVVVAEPPPPLPAQALLSPPEPTRTDLSQNTPAPPAPPVASTALSKLPALPGGLSLASALPSLSNTLDTARLSTGLADAAAVALRRPAPRYPPDARRRGIEGYVVVRMRVDERGRVAEAVVVRAKPRGVFERSARMAALAYRFSPARSGGHPVTATLEQRMLFELQ